MWGYQNAAVVAQSEAGDDQITLENYSRKKEEQDVAAALLQQLKVEYGLKVSRQLKERPQREELAMLMAMAQGKKRPNIRGRDRWTDEAG